LMGSTLLEQKNEAAAREQFVRALELAPNSLAALEQLVDLDLAGKKYAAAMQRVGKSVKDNPTKAAPRILMAKVFVTEGDTNQAETSLSKAVQLQPDSMSAYLLLAQLYFDSKQNQKALAELDAATEQNPTNISVLMLTGIIHNQEKDYQGAADAYESLLKINPKFSPALNNLAYIYSEHLDQPDKAYALAQQARQLRPDDPSTADTLGWVLFKKGRYPLAISLLQGSADQLPDQPEVHFHLGMAHYMMDDETPARAEFETALKSKAEFSSRAECAECLSILAIDPKTANAAMRAVLEKRVSEKSDDPVALARLAAIYQRDGNSDKAITTYEAALKADPKNVKTMIALAQLYAPKNLQKAFDLAKTAYDFAPDDAEASYVLGKLAYRSGSYKWAFSLLQQTAQTQPDNSSALYDFANAAYSIGKISDAQTAMQTALTLKPGLTPLQANAAKRFLDLTALANNPTQAVASLAHIREILKLQPDYVPALMVSAVIAEQKKNPLSAESAYENVLSRYPDFATAQKELAILYSKNATNTDKAYALAQKARETFPDDPDLAKAFGLIVFQQGDYGRAANLLRTAANEEPGDAELFYYLGLAEYNLKHFAESKTSLNRALTLNLAERQTVKAKQLLAEIK
ncbi:MAG: tetratricopeptide repeat protein, partial [Limisphaerales bacterium]